MSPHAIQRITAAHFNYSRDKLLNSRLAHIQLARAVAMYLCRKLLELSYPEIGREFKRDHTTVMQSVRKVTALIERKDGLHLDVESLTAVCNGKAAPVCPHCNRMYDSESIAILRGELEKLQRRLDRVAA